ncbi:hypothetical protein ACFL6G_06545 [candidate division KSB1 bacterium]
MSGITDGRLFYYEPATPHYGVSYHWSLYRFKKFNYQYPAAYGPMPHITVAEMDMLKAEAYLRGYGGTKADAADLINKTRVLNGEMEPLTGEESDLELWKWMCYEKRIETQLTGIAYFDYRSWAGMKIDGELVVHVPSGAMIQFPVPGKELQILLHDSSHPGDYSVWTTPSIRSACKIIDSEYIRKSRERINRHNKSRHKVPIIER